MSNFVMVRHGETTWNCEERIQGWAPVPLTENGRQQALQLGEALVEEFDIDQILSSDLYRAQEMTELLTEYIDAPVTFEIEWRERDIGYLQGLHKKEVFKRFPKYGLSESGQEAAFQKPDSGESLSEVHKRVVGRWQGLLKDCENTETVLIVTHRGPIRLLLGWIKEIKIVRSILEQPQANCSINELHYNPETGETTVVQENNTDHL